MESIFKKGDRVYDFTRGWGTFLRYDSEYDGFDCRVIFDDMKGDRSYRDTVMVLRTLSFTEYELKGLSHERPIDYNKWIGKYCMFWDDKDSRYILDRFKEYKIKGTHPFGSEYCNAWWKKCKLLSEVTLKELGITNK